MLNEKNVKYEDKLLSFGNKEHKSAEVLALNPRGQLPTFKHGDIIINESSAACAFVEEQYRDQGNPLMPSDAKGKALVLQRKDEFLINVPKFTAEISYLMFGKNAPSQEEHDKKIANAKAELKVWDGYVQKTGAYMAGDTFTLADAIIFPNLALLVRMGLQLESHYPGLDAWYKKVVDRPSVQSAWPPHWKDAAGKPLLKDVL